jgi:sulfatase maturation enzyme AslB (radical SAM superfamily)
MFNKDMQKLRSEFLSGGKPSTCEHCWHLESQNLSSNRQWHVKHLSKKFFLNYVDDIKIRSLDIKSGNVCNFKCRICNPKSSSLFAEEVRKFKTITVDDRWNEYNDYVWEELQELLPDIENIDFYGGEPFLVKKIPELLKYAVDNHFANNIRLHINSNGSVFPEKLIPVLLQFKSVDLALSIDNIGERFELERGGSWQEVCDNILNFAKLRSSTFNVYLMPTVNIQNILYLDELFDWATQHNISVTVNYLDFPLWANVNYMTETAKQLVIDKYGNSKSDILKNIANKIKNSPGSNGQDFIKNVKMFDQIRNQNFAETHSEIAKAMEYVYNSN